MVGGWGQNPNFYLLTGAVAFRWAIWLTRSDVIFDKYQPKKFYVGSFQVNALASTMCAIAAQ
jgi:hypothetical protein